MASPKILAFGGTTREGSWNKKLARAAADYARDAGAEATFADLRDYPMPLYDGDLEAADGKPATARQWKQLMVAHDGFLIATAEYNRSMTGALKNAIDWASRADDNDPRPVPAFRGKTVALMSASPGAFGGMRALYHVHDVLYALGCTIHPTQLAVPKVHEIFGDDGAITDGRMAEKVKSLAAGLVDLTLRMR